MLLQIQLFLFTIFSATILTAPTSHDGSNEVRQLKTTFKNGAGFGNFYRDSKGVLIRSRYASKMKALQSKYSIPDSSIKSRSFYEHFEPNSSYTENSTPINETIHARATGGFVSTFFSVWGLLIGKQTVSYEFDMYSSETVLPATSLSACADKSGGYDANSATAIQLRPFNNPVDVVATSGDSTYIPASGYVVQDSFKLFLPGLTGAVSFVTVVASVLQITRITTPIFCQGTFGLGPEKLYMVNLSPAPAPPGAQPLPLLPALIGLAGVGVVGVFFATIQLIGSNNPTGDSYASVTIGAVDHTFVTGSTPGIFTTYPTVSNRHWSIRTAGVYINNYKQSTVFPGNLVLDSLSPFILLKKALVDEFYKSIPGSKFNPVPGSPSSSMWTIPCSSASQKGGVFLSFLFAGAPTTFVIPSPLLIVSFSDTDINQCVGAVQYTPVGSYSAGSLGTPFLSAVYVKLIWDNKGAPATIALTSSRIPGF